MIVSVEPFVTSGGIDRLETGAADAEWNHDPLIIGTDGLEADPGHALGNGLSIDGVPIGDVDAADGGVVQTRVRWPCWSGPVLPFCG